MITSQIARQFREVHFGGNWTSVNLKETLAPIDLELASRKLPGTNSIAELVFHINYYVSAVLKVLQGGTLDASDKYSFVLPALETESGWRALVDKTLAEAEAFALEIEKLPDAQLLQDFTDPKYGSWYRNISGIIEHTHYHLGQIVLLKKPE